ncbi:5-(carboxyamino)imidazole ribonucleotide synthase [Facilibium subflavum]|uniref:5-(carboxyamino)imidazole ribonucleotide synthase n=1 Tax=Facilibium subflavum TaxID=2219058 RepID=UPI000E647FF5|nr:5-(carboxyamino)imidazole ribonucleotide synthase [Facilibium subflavum]
MRKESGKKHKIAILGQGQLAQMLIESVEDLPVEIETFALPVVNKDGICDDTEIQKYCQLLQSFDVITYEIENICVSLLRKINQKVPVYPAIDALMTAQDRLSEKQLFTSLGIKTNRYLAIKHFAELQSAAELLGFPFIVKTRRFGYDGKGQFLVKKQAQLQEVWAQFAGIDLIAEGFVDFDYEISQIASRDQKGNIVYYPLSHNQHHKGILRQSRVLQNNKGLPDEAQRIIKDLLEYFDYVGTLTIEFFVKDDVLYANEIAPRVHNSGHWSIDGANCSQFCNHMRAVAGFSVKPVVTTAQYIMMINLIGQDVPVNLKPNQYVKPKSYGKTLRSGRKMGHINIIGDEFDVFEKHLNETYQQLQQMTKRGVE